MSGVNVYFFGAPRIERDGAVAAVERRKSLALLAYLAVTRQSRGREALATLLWPEVDAERGRASLRRALADLTAALGKGYVVAEGDQIALRADSGLRVDVEHFHDALAQVAAHSHSPYRLCDACLAHLAEAASLYTGDFLTSFTLADAADFDAWQTFQTESLRLELAAALERLACGLAGRQQYAAALPHARRWLALDPLHEPAQRLLMRLHAWAGDRAAVARQYRECGKVLQAELGVEPEPETTALYESLMRGTEGAGARGSAGAGASVPAAPHNLPPDLTPFVGREMELAQIAQRLADPACRLLTVLGPGGIGKTRLAVQAARGQTDLYTHGVFFVDLAPVAAADFLAAAIVRALPIAPSAADAQVQLAGFLRDKHLLLVLDNFEHLVEGADLLPRLLADAPKLKLLVTSRSRLNLREEWLAPLEGMQAPPAGVAHEGQDHEDAEEYAEREVRSNAHEPSRSVVFAPLRDFAILTSTLERYSATALFLACVRRLRPDFQPAAADAGHIVRICRLLDGIPLAIELAAARTRALPLETIAVDLEDGLQLLSTTLRDVPHRHRSMTAAFDYSWRLLSPHHQAILRQFSVFPGSCTAEAAAAVTGATIDDLGELADASWLRLSAAGRCDVHELTRQYCAARLATEHLAQSGETAHQARGRHAAYYQALLLARQGEFIMRPEAVTNIATEYANLLAAWNWFVATDGLHAVRTMVPGLSWLADRQGEGRAFMQLLAACARQLTQGAATTGQAPDRLGERELALAALLAALLGEYYHASRESWDAWTKEATSLLARAETDDEQWRETRWVLRLRIAQGHRLSKSNAEAANMVRTLLAELDEECFSPWPYTEDAHYWWQIEGLSCLAWCASFLGQYDEMQRLAEQIIALAQQVGAETLRLKGLEQRAWALLHAGNCAEAEQSARELLRTYHAIASVSGVIWAFYLMGAALAGQGSYVRAHAYLRRSLAYGRETGQGLVESLGQLAGVEVALGNLVEARRYYREMIPLCEGQVFSGGLVVSLTGLARVALATGDRAGARAHLLRALHGPSSLRNVQHTIVALATIAELEQAVDQWEAATELCAALLSWPATPHYVPNTLQRLQLELEMRLRQLEAQLPPEIFAAATARGRARHMDEVVAELIAEHR